jgi:Raf kinase inhibitor-like YbhB/YbcL family protein
VFLAAAAVAGVFAWVDTVAAGARLALSSPAFRAGTAIPRVYTCDGRGDSPPLRWTAPPRGAGSLALRVYDIEASGFTHWIAWGISTRSRRLQTGQRPPKQGRNDFGRIGYGGPCPPKGKTHHYVFVLYVLAKPLSIRPGSPANAFTAALKAAQVLAHSNLVGTYKRR